MIWYLKKKLKERKGSPLRSDEFNSVWGTGSVATLIECVAEIGMLPRGTIKSAKFTSEDSRGN